MEPHRHSTEWAKPETKDYVLLSFHISFLRFVHIAVHIVWGSSSLLYDVQLGKYHSLFIHSAVDEFLNSFQANMNSAINNILEHVFWWMYIHIYVVYVPRNEISGL